MSELPLPIEPLSQPSGKNTACGTGRTKELGGLKLMLSDRVQKPHLLLSPSSATTWRQLDVCQLKEQLHLKAISFLIAERLHSRCLAAGPHFVLGTKEAMGQAASHGPTPHRAELAWAHPNPAQALFFSEVSPSASVTQVCSWGGRSDLTVCSLLDDRLAA